MNGRTAACLAACAAVLLTAGVIDKAAQQHPAAPLAPTASASPAVWIQHLGDAQTELESTTTAIRAAHLNGQPIAPHQQHCRAAVSAYNEAAAHLHLSPLDPSTECTP